MARAGRRLPVAQGDVASPPAIVLVNTGPHGNRGAASLHGMIFGSYGSSEEGHDAVTTSLVSRSHHADESRPLELEVRAQVLGAPLPDQVCRSVRSTRERSCRLNALRVKSVALCNGRLHLDFRYTLLATKLARDCNMSRWAKRRLPGKGLYQVQCGDFL
jgi:hypothetical protein